MKFIQLAIILAAMMLLTTPAIADQTRGRGNDKHNTFYGERIDRQPVQKRDVIQHRFEHKAMRAEAQGKFHKANRMLAKGERIHQRMDRQGDRMHAYYDPRHVRQHNRDQVYWQTSTKPRVIYRNHAPYGSYFGLVFNQPGLSIGWGFYDD